jgi:hypothetical protein
MEHNIWRACALIGGLSIFTACNGSDDEASLPDPAELACEETDEAGSEVTAATERDETAPEVEIGGEPYTVALSADEPTYLRVEVTEDTAAILLLGTEDAVTALYHEQEEEELSSAGPDEFCADEIPEHFDVDLHEPGTYFIELAPSAQPEVWLLLLNAEGHGHDHEH